MKWPNRILFACNLAFFAGAVWFLSENGAASIAPGKWEYKDLISILLTVVSVIVTFIGIIVAVAAIWGYQSIRNVAEQKAEETSRQGCDDYLRSDVFRNAIDLALQARIELHAKEAVQNALGPAVLSADAAPEFKQDDREWRD